MSSKIIKASVFLGAILISCSTTGINADAKAMPVKMQNKNIKVGQVVSATTKLENVKFKSSDSSVASVDENGTVIGKKAGKVVISATKSGYSVKSFNLNVKKTKGKPDISVALNEVSLTSQKMSKKDNKYTFQGVVKNKSAKGTIKKIEYIYDITIEKVVEKPTTIVDPQTGTETVEKATEIVKEKKQVTLKATNIKALKKSKKISCMGDYTGKVSNMKLKKVKLYTKDALCVYDVSKKKYSLSWNGKDTKAPKFSGWVGKESYYNGVAIRACYSDRKNTYNFKKNVKAVDDRDGKVSFTVDTSKINWKKSGTYKVYYTAKDKAGNVAKTYAKVDVYKIGMDEAIADEVLNDITKKSWSDEKKLLAIYKYCKKHCSYVDNGTHKNWKAAAVKGIRYQSGDCFTFYSMARLLITRAGIHNLMITRYPARTGSHHWWNLVYVKGGWYHFDTTPRRRDGRFFLVTYAQLMTYSSGSTFKYNMKLAPKTATKKISPNP